MAQRQWMRARWQQALLGACVVGATTMLTGVTLARVPASGGLDSLSDDRLLAELAQRGLDSLLERAFEVNNVPADQRQATRALIAMRELRNPASKLTPRQRDELIARVVSGMERALDTQRDPKLLVDNAEELIRAAVFRELNTLEYWGDTTQTRSRLRPVAQTVSRMLGRASELARKQADDLANKMTASADQAALDRYAQLDQLASRAEYTRRINDYAVIASLDPADASRTKISTETLEYLRQFDNPDSTVQPTVRIQAGKVLLAKGEFESAAKELDTLTSDATVLPVPTASQKFEARYFAAVALMKAGNTAEAQRRRDELARTVAAEFRDDARTGADAALMMLQYRIFVAAKDDTKARQALIVLVKARPEFESTVLEQLASRLPENPDIKSLDVLMLRAVFRRGEMEQRKTEGQSVDGGALGQGVAAGRELLARRALGGIDSGVLEDTAIKLPLLLEKQGKRLDAAVALLDFIDTFGVGHRNAAVALDEATFLIAALRKESPEDADVAKAYERLLAIAVLPPFSKVELAYEWARRLQQTGRFVEAVKYFEQVPPTDSRAAMARFFRMVALKQILDDSAGLGKPASPPDERRRRASDILALADQVATEARARLAQGASATARNDKLILVRTALVGADVALREQKDPARALRQLDDFESATEGLSSQKDLISQAMTVRVLARMDLGQNQEATRTLVALLETTGGSEGADIVFKLLTRLNEDFDKARAANDAAAVRALARARAELSGFLVTWAEKNSLPAIRELTPRYRLFDADTKRLAADLEPDPVARQKGLEGALALYESLKARVDSDPVVDFGIAVIAYDLGQFDRARDLLAVLLNDRRLGRPTIEEDRNGETVVLPNDRYWEATLKLMRSTLKLTETGKAGPEARAAIIDGLKALYARWGQSLGGPKWSPEFEKLRQEIAPDFAIPILK